ncbi:hypothetical protein HDU98_001253 [Podochytrium sp. JEL0797]|nr:hypothetical protein HDU98_001253 [Podochytrium sp. JEL0797]
MPPKKPTTAPPKKVPVNDNKDSDPAAKKAATKKPKEVVIKMSHLMDSGMMYVLPFAYGLYMGHDPRRLVIGFVIQALVFVALVFTVYGPFYPSSFHRAWDLVYRYQDLKTADVMQWDANPVVAVSEVDAPPPDSRWRWFLRLVLRKGSGFHLLVALSTVESAFVAVPLVLISSYYVM